MRTDRTKHNNRCRSSIKRVPRRRTAGPVTRTWSVSAYGVRASGCHWLLADRCPVPVSAETFDEVQASRPCQGKRSIFAHASFVLFAPPVAGTADVQVGCCEFEFATSAP
ncbi:hypothetical protein BaRGS_00026719 [Batillaria attramentaria]|uniref:Uncharacterized protein n=1 Tax=Batillaria attramentaria TaxID=370345 RepID=A0ABD0K5C8_9CAEN